MPIDRRLTGASIVCGMSLVLAMLSASPLAYTNNQGTSPASADSKPVTFKGSIGPLLKEKCSPCHFEGGKVFDRYPFDKYETVRKLGKRLNTRFKDENARLVSRWIENGSPEREAIGQKR